MTVMSREKLFAHWLRGVRVQLTNHLGQTVEGLIMGVLCDSGYRGGEPPFLFNIYLQGQPEPILVLTEV